MGIEQGKSSAAVSSTETVRSRVERVPFEVEQRVVVPIKLNGGEAPSYYERYTKWHRKTDTSVPSTVITKGMYREDASLLFEEDPERVVDGVEKAKEVLNQLQQEIPGAEEKELQQACIVFLKRHRSQADREAVKGLEYLSEKYEPYLDQVLQLADLVTQQQRAELMSFHTPQK